MGCVLWKATVKVADERAVRCPDDGSLLAPLRVKFDLGEKTFIYRTLYCKECDSYLTSYGMERDLSNAAEDFLEDSGNHYYPNIISLDPGD